MPLGKGYDGQDCSLARALEVVGERWTLLVLRDCFFGVRRFSDLRAHLDVPRAVLSARLGALVDAGLLRRVEYLPNRHEYLLTARAEALWPVLYGLTRWGAKQSGEDRPSRLFFHVDCGTQIDDEGRCPRCAVRSEPGDLETRPGPAATTRRDDPVSRALRSPHRLLTPVVTS
jgi:DNA-binding HxlR family transcriptional regulator